MIMTVNDILGLFPCGFGRINSITAWPSTSSQTSLSKIALCSIPQIIGPISWAHNKSKFHYRPCDIPALLTLLNTGMQNPIPII